ncbi:hypothetical protein BGZ74_007732 [Mortierella antarctica]|nr:hypothetical protein BGZ74_007732 [Mortierella antarctica]
MNSTSSIKCPMATTAQCPFNSLPTEVFHTIFNTLSEPEFVNCSRASKSLYRLCAPYLWSKIHIQSSSQLKDFQTTEAQSALSRNSRHVRSLFLFKELHSTFLPLSTAASEGYLPLCTNLKELHLSTFCEGAPFNRESIPKLTPEVEDAIISLIRQNPSLTSFTIRSQDLTDETLLRITAKELPNLQVLRIVPFLSPWIAKMLLEGLPESIQNISLLVRSDDDRDRTIMLRANNEEAVQSRNHHSLEALNICCLWNMMDEPQDETQDELELENPTRREENILIPFLDTCGPALKSFVGYSTKLFCNERIRRALGRTSVEWTCLSFDDVPQSMISSDGDIAALIRAGPHWEVIDLYGYEEAGPLTQVAILDHAARLRHLDISYISSFSSEDLCTILSKCKSLVRFTAIDPVEPDPAVNPVISGADFIQLDWASTSLAAWNCMITVPRSNGGDEEEEDGQANNEMESHKIQQQVYQKLAQQTRLRELKLGLLDRKQVPEDESWYQTQCLEMTLASGMDELAGLKDLRQLDVSYMNHNLGVRELEWMAEHWPKLKKIDGLFRGCRDPRPVVHEWLATHQPDWVVDDNVRQERQTALRRIWY